MSERSEDLGMVAVEKFIQDLIKKYYENHLGDRIGEVENGENIYSQTGRQPDQVGEEVRSIDQRVISG